ncbi:MAG TPA: anthranilate phosphoribosyltransferase [Bacteroidales bacterium]|nr:anthranilate phosphoribosyltransferase [Bacteroidales bacterium]
MKNILNQLFQHQTLEKESARQVLIKLANGEYNASQMAAFLTVFQLRNITLEELQGFREALLELCIPIVLSEFNTVDLCGTGGDQKDTFNISTLASFVVAGAGEKVVKHGNYGVSSVCGSSNILEYFGYEFTNNQDRLKRELETAGICFLHAPLFNPAMKNIAPVRRELSVKTFFNMLGPMVNPSSPKNQLVGVFNLELARMYNYIYQKSGVSYTVVHSLDGYDEISLTGDFQVLSNHVNSIVSPSEIGFQQLAAVELKGGVTIEESAGIFIHILKGEGTTAQNNAVIANAAFALNTIYPNKSIKECIEKARYSLESREALKSFQNLVKVKEFSSL